MATAEIESSTTTMNISDQVESVSILPPGTVPTATIASGTGSTSSTLSGKALEAKALDIFKQLICDLELDEFQRTDTNLMRWLMAREMDPIKALTMFKEHLEWRKDFDMDNILSWEHPSHMVKDFPFQLCGLDKDGDPFGVVTWRKMDVDGALKIIHEGRVHEYYLRYLYKALELVHRIYKEISTPEKTVFQGTVIIDLDGFSAYQFASRDVVELVLEVVRRYEASYPNMLKSAILVNTPTVFTVFYNIIKPFLGEYTLSRVQIYSWVGQDWKSVLRAAVPAQLLPSHVGGANTTCKYYEFTDGYKDVQPPVLEDFPRENMVLVNVPACQKVTFDYQIDTPGTMLSWGFRTDYYDIGFTVLNENVEVVDNCRVDAHVLQQKGFLICNTPGKYTLVFDNSFSNYRAKSVYYTVKVTPPSLIK